MAGVARQNTRARILQGARELLDFGEYGDFTVDALARRLQMSKATFYRYFSTKEILVETLVVEACDATDAVLSSIAVGREARADVEVRRLVETIEAYADAVPRAVMHGRERLPSSVQARLIVTRVALEQAAIRTFELAKAQGWMDLDHPDVLARAVIAAFDAALDAAARRDPPAPRAAAIRTVADLMIAGLRR